MLLVSELDLNDLVYLALKFHNKVNMVTVINHLNWLHNLVLVDQKRSYLFFSVVGNDLIVMLS